MIKAACVLGLAIGLTAAPAPAFAQTWVNIGKNTYGSTYDVDWDSIRRDGSRVTFTLRTVYGPGGPSGDADGYVAHRQANCTTRIFHDLQTDYMKNGAVKNSTGVEEDREAKAGSIAASVLDKVCS